MTINKAYFVSKVNDVLHRSEGDNDLDTYIEDIIYDASTFGDILLKESYIELSAGSYYLSMPEISSNNAKCKKILGIYNDDFEELEHVLWPRIKKWHENTTSQSEPEMWSISPDNYIYLAPIADGSYRIMVQWSYYHPMDADNILYDDELKYALSYGVLWQYAMSKGLDKAEEKFYNLYVNTMNREAAQRGSKKTPFVKWKRGM